MRILIWGTGALARHYMKFELFSGYEIAGFIDTNRKEEMFMGYPVILPDQISKMEYNILVVCVKNANTDILNRCIQNGLDLARIFFVHAEQGFAKIEEEYAQKLMSDEEAQKRFPMIFQEKNRRMMRGRYRNDVSSCIQELKDDALIKKYGESHVIAWIPIELLFSEKREDNDLNDITDAWIEQNTRWENLPLIAFAPYQNLYQFCMYGREYPRLYCQWYQDLFLTRGITSGLSDEKLVEMRFHEFEWMQNQFNQGMNFFIEHPAAAKWNKCGYFNLIDGHHRAAFLYHSGVTRIPVQITVHDYELWCNRPAVEEVQRIICKQGRTEFYQPILNPYFLRIHSHRENYAKSRLHHFLEYFQNTRFVGKRILDIGANLGYMGQAFDRMGAEVTLIEPDTFHYELTIALNQLLYTNCKVVTQKFEEYDCDGTYDMAILLTIFYHYLHKEEICSSFLEKLNRHVSTMILWESGDEPEEEKTYILQHTKFKDYIHLGYTYATGKFRELGIFQAEDLS